VQRALMAAQSFPEIPDALALLALPVA
jgi:hypothetical protein